MNKLIDRVIIVEGTQYLVLDKFLEKNGLNANCVEHVYLCADKNGNCKVFSPRKIEKYLGFVSTFQIN